jgi:GT2 family glycosyltransferase
VSVVIPCRNAPAILAATLAHYWANAHHDKLVSSVVLLDNCSTAPGMDAVFADAMRRGARVIRHEKNLGVWTSLNRGLVLAGQSEKIFILTSDILLAPDALALLDAIQDDSGCAFLGPRVVSDQFDDLWKLYEEPEPAEKVDYSTYNGAAFLMTRECIEKVGYFDSGMYVCYGDTDYAQRVRDAGLQYGVTDAARCLHLDKRSRRADHTASQDTDIEIQDWERFAEKWKHRPDVMVNHHRPDQIVYNMMKERYWANTVISQNQTTHRMMQEVSK